MTPNHDSHNLPDYLSTDDEDRETFVPDESLSGDDIDDENTFVEEFEPPASEKIVVSARPPLSQRARRAGMFDLPEIMAVSVAGAALLSVALMYFFGLQPAREDLRKARIARESRQSELAKLQDQAQTALNQQTTADQLITSEAHFENTFLPLSANGNSALYQRLNELIRANNLKNTAGPEYAPLELARASQTQPADKQGRGGNQPGLFPGTFVTVTVEGNYANLRHFINEIENTRQFIVISAIELESTATFSANQSNAAASTSTLDSDPLRGIPTNPNPNNFQQNIQPPQQIPNGIIPPGMKPPPFNQVRPAPKVTAPRSKTGSGGNNISLRLEMAAYFRRGLNAAQN